MSDNFYRAFEERHYAPREVIKGLRRQYLPFVEPLTSIYPGGKAYDLGCGRGEWLELMAEQGLIPFGVDLDAGMLQACAELGLPAIQGDAVAHLQTLESDSHVLVSAFHVVEHITFEQLRSVVAEAFRVLKPGGILILETPNPENISVATHNFYQDPTHQKPIPPTLLSFAVEHGGFGKVKVLRLQERQALHNPAHVVSLLDVIRGPSPDYAIVAQKEANPDVEASFDEAFSVEYGLSLEQLVRRYDGRLEALQQRQHEMEKVILENAETIRRVETALVRTETVLAQTQGTLQAMYDSRSWRMTAPLRRGADFLRKVRSVWGQGGAKGFIWHVSRYVNNRPALRRAALWCINRVPGLKQRLARSLVVASRHASNAAAAPMSTEMAGLSPRAKSLYAQFKLASDNRHKERK